MQGVALATGSTINSVQHEAAPVAGIEVQAAAKAAENARAEGGPAGSEPACPSRLARLVEKVVAVFSFIYGTPARVLHCLGRQASAAYNRFLGALDELFGTRPAVVPTVVTLPDSKPSQRLAMSLERCRKFLALDAKKGQLLKRFGITCPEGGEPTEEQVEAMITRTEAVMQAANHILQARFGGRAILEYTAEDVLIRQAPEQLFEVLSTAYTCNLCVTFANVAALGANEGSLEDANEKVRAWLESKEAQETTKLVAQSVSLSCIPSELGRLKKLEQLCLNDNAIVTIAPEVWELSGLKGLWLAGNWITEVGSGIGKLEGLELLQLENNHLTKLPPEIGGLTNLQFIYLAHNRALPSLPMEMGRLTRLRTRTLDESCFVPPEVMALPPFSPTGQ